MQTKWQSFLEAKTNTVIAFSVSWAVMMWVVPFIWDADITAGESLSITALFTLISVIRNYIVRRIFNRIKERADTR